MVYIQHFLKDKKLIILLTLSELPIIYVGVPFHSS